jgi:hypothetical protein
VTPNIKKSSDSKTPKTSLINVWLIIVFATLITVTIVIRIRTLNVSLERDEGEYAYAGQLILQGVPPYSLAYNMKMPGIYAAYAIILACFGQTQSGIHAGVLVINTATILLLFLLTKKLFGPIAGTASAIFFAITSISNTVQPTANAENFVVVFAIAGIILLMMFAESKKYISLATGGLLLGIAFMMKQHGAGFILFGFLFLLWNQIYKKPINWLKIISVILVYSLAVFLPFLATCLILWYCGVFDKFWFWTFEYARHYVAMIPFAFGITQELTGNLTNIILSSPLLWLTALFGLLSVIWNKEIRKHIVFLIGFLICSFLCICPGFFFRPHYFVLFLPVIAVLAGAGIIAIRDLLELFIKSKTQTAFISILVILVIWLQSFYIQREYLLQFDPVIISRMNFGPNPFPEAVLIADYIKKHSSKDDKIAVIGSEPEIFFYSQRRSVTPYIYAYPLMEPQPYAADMQREMISQIETSKPKFIVFVKFAFSWLVTSRSNLIIFDWVPQYIPSHYRQVGLVEMHSLLQTSYHWDSVTKPSKPDGWIYIGERID